MAPLLRRVGTGDEEKAPAALAFTCLKATSQELCDARPQLSCMLVSTPIRIARSLRRLAIFAARREPEAWWREDIARQLSIMFEGR